MYQEHIWSNIKWKGRPWHDTVFVKVSDDVEIMPVDGMLIAQVLLFSFYDPIIRQVILCALVNWFMPVLDQHDKVMGTWEVKIEMVGVRPTLKVIHLNSIMQGAHLLPAYGRGFLSEDFNFRDALDAFQSDFVNNLIDYHTHELLQIINFIIALQTLQTFVFYRMTLKLFGLDFRMM